MPLNFDKSPAGSVTLKAPSTGSVIFTLPSADGTSRQLMITDASGVLSFTTLIAADIPTLTASKISDFDTQVRTSRLDQMASPTASVSFNSQKITSLLDPTNAQDAATKSYVDAMASGLDPKASVRVSTQSNITISNPGTAVIDGITLTSGDRVLVRSQTTASQNGIYIFNGSGSALTRSTDADTIAELNAGAFTFVEEGTDANAGFVMQKPTGTYVLGTSDLAWVQFSGAGQVTAGTGLSKTGNTISLSTPVSGANGGTGLSSIGTGFLKGNGTILSYASLSSGDIPDLSSSYVAMSGSVTISGTKTFSSAPIFSTLTGYLKGNGSSALSASASIPVGDLSGTLPVGNGGTGATTLTSAGVLLGNGTSAISATSAGTAYQILRVGSGGGAPAFGSIDISQSSAVTGTLAGANGGTGLSSIGTGFLKGNGTILSYASLASGDIPDLSSTYVALSGAQTVSGAKTFSGGILVTTITASANNYLVLGSSGTPVRQIDTYLTPTNGRYTDVFAYNTTSNATATELFVNGSTTRMTLVASEVWRFEANVLGTQTGGASGTVGDTIAVKLVGSIKRSSGGTTSMVGAVSQDIEARDTGAAAWTATATADATNNSLKITCTGEASKTILWQAKVSLIRAGATGNQF